MKKCVVLFSGGLDSILAVKIMKEQGFDVNAVFLKLPFLKEDIEFIKDFCKKDNVKLKIIDCSKGKYLQEYLNILKNPKYGRGVGFNPCIDCKILMLKQAKNIMTEVKASFIATGEVLGQRPMSQQRQSLKRIEEESGLKGLLVRPLSALLLASTIPQEKGWLREEFLFDIQGRGRRRQIDLAKEWGVEEYPWPGGGCLLTDSHFCRRLKDLLKYDKLSIEDIELLKLGRHFRITPDFKLIVGRDKEENEKLFSLAKKEDLLFEPKNLPGPTGIGRGLAGEELKDIAARIIARYTSLDLEVEVVCRTVSRKNGELISAKGVDERQLKEWIV